MKKFVSIMVTAAMLMCTVIPVAAQEQTTPVVVDDGSSHTVNNDVHVADGTGLTSTNGSDVTVNGSVAVDGTGVGVSVSGEGSGATITGNASAGESSRKLEFESKGVEATNGASVTVNGDAFAGTGEFTGLIPYEAFGVYADNSNVEVGGSAYAGVEGISGTGVCAKNGAFVNVEGDARAGTKGMAIWADDATVTVGGNAFASTGENGGAGIFFRNTSTVYVGKDVSGMLAVRLENPAQGSGPGTGNGTVIVEGTISGSTADIAIIHYSNKKIVPEFVIGTLENNTICEEVHELFEDVKYVPVEGVFEKIKYIIKAKGMQVVSIMNSEGTEKEEADRTYINEDIDKEFMVANETDKITLVIDPVEDGYRIKSLNFGKYVKEVVKNEDGSLTVTVARGGDLNFEAVLEKIQKDKPVPDEEKEDTPADTSSDTSKQAAAVKKTASRTAYTVGSQIWLNGHIWIITDINKETGVWSLSCIDTMTEEQIADPDETLKQYLTENELNCVIPDEITEKLSSLAEQEVADKYFEGDVNHLSIKCYSSII